MPVKSIGTVLRSKHDPRKPATLTREQEARLDAMTDDEITAAAWRIPDAQPWSDAELADADQALGAKIRITRLKLGMSQAAFADAFGFALRALQDWEQGRAEPPPAICHYLRVIDREPDAVKRALAWGAGLAAGLTLAGAIDHDRRVAHLWDGRGHVAQLAERRTFNPRVLGRVPARPPERSRGMGADGECAPGDPRRCPRAGGSEAEMKLGLYLRNMGPQSSRDRCSPMRARGRGGGHRRSLGRRPHRAPARGCRRLGRALPRSARDTRLPRRGHRARRPGRRRADRSVPTGAADREVDRDHPGALRRRLILGVGVGWMEKEFRAARRRPAARGAMTDKTLAFLHALLRRRRGRGERRAVPVPPAPGAAADLRRRRAAARHPPRRELRRRLDADGGARREAGRRRREAARRHGRGRQAAARGRAAALAAGRRHARARATAAASSPRSA